MTVRRQIHLLPADTVYDAVILGTSLPSSILASSLALADLSVLHLDINPFYSSTWATLSASHLSHLTTDTSHPSRTSYGTPPFPAISARFGPNPTVVELDYLPLHLRLFPHGARLLPPHPSLPPLPPQTADAIYLDLICKPIMSAGSLVDLLARTNVGHYIDFRPLDALYLEFGSASRLQKVPSSRAEVFQNRFLTMLEKRLLMRFVKLCQEYHTLDEQSFDKDQVATFRDLMQHNALSDKLGLFLEHSIAFCAPPQEDGGASVSAAEGVQRVRLFQNSLLRYRTRTPFLYANYGSGELAQAFCRLSAVHGGTYVLNRGASALVKAEDGRMGIVTTEGEVVEGRHLFVEREYVKGWDGEGRVWRMCGVVDGSIVRDEGVKRLLISVPKGAAGNEKSVVRIWQVDSDVRVCPEGYYLVYAETAEEGGREEDLLAAVGLYIDLEEVDGEVQEGGAEDREGGDIEGCQAERKVRLVWGMTYERSVGRGGVDEEGFVVISGEDTQVDGDVAIEEALRCFKIVRPRQEFFRTEEVEGGEGEEEVVKESEIERDRDAGNQGVD